ncbi:MAG: M1 family peptidase, partial [Candidatus Eremiobacteraeota bacterium]|nr:M1 family peptidase [Candidatus Eremiobacteraeota bacterium]
MKIANSNPVRLTHSACLHQHRHPVNTAAPVDSFVPTASGPSIPEQGEAGLGDSLFPNLGNGGYDAQHYRVEVDVDERGNLQGKTTMTARAERDLASFHLDFRGFDISKITVNGQSAPYERQDAELIIHPQQLLSGGQDFDVSVEYAGTPHGYRSPFAPVRLGWNNFRDGSYVVSQPDGASSWYPVNDHPSDKATYDFEITVPRPLVAV